MTDAIALSSLAARVVGCLSLEIAERLWLSVADEATMPVPATHKRVFKKRLANYANGTSQPIPHEELMRQVRSA